jgi:Na+:H+ antiporter, NhaA family
VLHCPHGPTRHCPYTVPSAYRFLALILWAPVLKSSIHATLAGVALGFVIPLAPGKDVCSLLLQDYEVALHPWVVLQFTPVFIFANAFVPLFVFTWADLWQLLPLGIVAALPLQV